MLTAITIFCFAVLLALTSERAKKLPLALRAILSVASFGVVLFACRAHLGIVAFAIVPTIVGYTNPFPTYATFYTSPYLYGPLHGVTQAIRWGLSRGILMGAPFTAISIAPNTGPAAGGTPFSIRGTGFLTGATVTIGGNPATGVVVENTNLIIGVTPAHAAGAVDVVVTNPGGATSTLVAAFTYT